LAAPGIGFPQNILLGPNGLDHTRARSRKSSRRSTLWQEQACRRSRLVQGELFFQARSFIPKLAIARRLPMLAYSKETFEGGALACYAPNQVEMCRRSAVYADKILKGAKPGDLPVEQPTKFEFLINLNTAKTLSLDVPLHLQQLAGAASSSRCSAAGRPRRR
jgi:hypothetical protein